jgi:hypothetical protein
MSKKRKLTPFRRKYLSFRTAERRREVKIEAIEYKGGKCIKCGYDKCPTAMIFHHLDPSQKDFGIAENGRAHKNLDQIKSELDKCVLLCSNCHLETHYEEYQKNRERKFQEIELEKRKFADSVDKNCSQCNESINVFASQLWENNFCSTKCRNLFVHNNGWVSDNELLQMKETMSVKEIATILNKNWRSVYKRLSKIKKN